MTTGVLQIPQGVESLHAVRVERDTTGERALQFCASRLMPEMLALDDARIRLDVLFIARNTF